MFLWRNTQNYPLIIIKYPPYLFYCKFLAALPKRHQTASWCQWRLRFFIAALPGDLFNVFLFRGKIYKHVLWICWKSGVNTTIRSLVISLTCQYLPLTLRRSVRAQDEGTSIQMYSLHQIKAKYGSTRSLKVKNLNSLCTVMNKALICQLHFFNA